MNDHYILKTIGYILITLAIGIAILFMILLPITRLYDGDYIYTTADGKTGESNYCMPVRAGLECRPKEGSGWIMVVEYHRKGENDNL